MKKALDKKEHADFTDYNRSEDRTGRDRIVSNVLWGWGGYLFIIVTGFIMPRMIDRHIGQFNLGIWDFCWSMVSYLSLSNLGIGSSVNRYVAKFRANNDIEGLCKAVSSVAFVQLFIGSFIFVGTIVLSLLLPHYFSDQLGKEINSAQWVVVTLGLSISLEQALNSFRGVMTGCHRWDFHNGLNVFSRVIEFGGMISVLFLGMGLRALGVAYLCAISITECIRLVMAYRVCPELRIRLKYVSWQQSKEMILFGWKTVVATLSPLVLVQTTNIIVVGALGPAMLAVLARSVTLVRHVETIINRFAFITTPTAGAMQANNQMAELKQFLLDSTRYTVAIVFPVTLIFIFFGDMILDLWMGPQYAQGWALAVLAIGYFLPISQSPVLRILVGLNLHGKIGLISLIVALTIFALGAIAVNIIGWNLVNTVMLISIPLTVGNGIIIPIFACRHFKIPLMKYVRYVFYMPTVCALALGSILYFSRVVFPANLFAKIIFGIVVGSLIIGVLYWRFILPRGFRSRIIHFIQKHLPFYKRKGDYVLG